jgi:hypothetical protein
MPDLLTKETNNSIGDFIDTIENFVIVEDSKLLLSIMEEITKVKPKVWGNERVSNFIIGFGKSTYKRKGSNKELEWFKVGFSPNKNKLTVHLNFNLQYEDNLLNELGKFRSGKSCLYVRKLSDINLDILIQLIDKSILTQEKTIYYGHNKICRI